MFTNAIKKTNQNPTIRQPGEYNILNNLEESFLLQKNNPEFDSPWDHPWRENQLEQLDEIYHKLKNDKHSHGYSKSTNKEFLRMFIIKYFASDGFFIFPSYFTYGEEGDISYCLDPEYKDLWDNYEMRVEHSMIKTKWLTHLTFNHVLSDGRIIEHIYDPHNLYGNNSNQDMFFNMRKLNEQHNLIVSLDTELLINTPKKDKHGLKI